MADIATRTRPASPAPSPASAPTPRARRPAPSAAPGTARPAAARRSPASLATPAAIFRRPVAPGTVPPSVLVGGPPGAPLAPAVAARIGGSLGVDLSGVRLHTDTGAAAAAKTQKARAFTYGNHIFLGAGERPTDVRLLAHEVAHVVHQRAAPTIQLWTPSGGDRFEHEAHRASAAVLGGHSFTVSERAAAGVQRWELTDLVPGDLVHEVLSYFSEYAEQIPGYRLFTIVIGLDPLTLQQPDRSAASILRALVQMLPGGKLITDALDKYGVFDKAGAYVDQQFRTLGITAASIKKAVEDFAKTVDAATFLAHPLDTWEKGKQVLAGPVQHLLDFGKGLATAILNLVKDAILRPLAGLAQGTRGWDLLCALLGKNPITGDAVPRNAETLIGGLLKLIGHEDVLQNMQEAHAFARAEAWFKRSTTTLVGFISQLPTLFSDFLKSLQVFDLLDLVGLLKRVTGTFGDFAGKFVTWGLGALWDLLEIIFDSVAPGLMPYIKKTGAALKSILQNPAPFMTNLVNAAKQGFNNFKTNFFDHLKAGLLEWLTGALPGVYIPKAMELGEIVKFVLSVLGISWANVRQKLVKIMPDTVVTAMETGFDVVVTLVRDGPAAAWDKIKESLSNLKDTVIGGITDFVVNLIVTRAVPQLIAMFIPGAGFITAIVKIYDTIMTFADQLSRIAQVVKAFVDGIVRIAAGDVAGVVARVESILSSFLTLAINFLAGFLGLGKVADKVMKVLDRARQPIDKALDALVAWIAKGWNALVATGKALWAKGRAAVKKAFGKEDKPPPPADATAAAGVKGDALDEIRRRGGSEKYASFAAFHTMVSGIFNELRPRGLKGLAVSVSPTTLAVTVSATASPPNSTTLRWADFFTATPPTDADLAAVLQNFRKGGRETYAALAVNGKLVGAAPNADDHAEMELLHSSTWDNAVAQASKTGTEDKKADFSLLINRSPCGSRCTPNLARWLRSNPDLKKRVRFIIAATGNYAPPVTIKELAKRVEEICIARQQELPPGVLTRLQLEEMLGPLQNDLAIRSDDATSMDNLRMLGSAGWELHALDAGKGSSPSGKLFERRIELLKAEEAAKARQRVGSP